MANHPTDGIGLFRIDVQTGDFVAVPRPPGHFGYLPAASPDGKAIIYQGSVKEPKKYCVLLRDLETGKNKELYCFLDPAIFASRLTLSPEGMRDICLHPDGRQIAFTSVQNRDEVWVLENFLPGAK